MIRTWSLLLRTSHRRGYIVAGRFDTTALVESPYLMHPIEHKTAGDHMDSIAYAAYCHAPVILALVHAV
jgi:DNA polymerase delta subunit 1